MLGIMASREAEFCQGGVKQVTGIITGKGAAGGMAPRRPGASADNQQSA